jgi:hypothetical protein
MALLYVIAEKLCNVGHFEVAVGLGSQLSSGAEEIWFNDLHLLHRHRHGGMICDDLWLVHI